MDKKRLIKQIYLVFGTGMIIATVIRYFIAFIIAYSTPEKGIILLFNTSNEANLELFTMICSIPAVSYLFYLIIKESTSTKWRKSFEN